MEETLNKLANKKKLTEADKLKIDVLTKKITGKGFTPKIALPPLDQILFLNI